MLSAIIPLDHPTVLPRSLILALGMMLNDLPLRASHEERSGRALPDLTPGHRRISQEPFGVRLNVKKRLRKLLAICFPRCRFHVAPILRSGLNAVSWCSSM